MKSSDETPLAYIMDVLKIRGAEIARLVHVHPSIISRWRKGNKAFNPNTRYYNEVVTAILDIDAQRGMDLLQNFLLPIYGTDVKEPGGLRKCLCLWLSGINTEMVQSQTPYRQSSAYVSQHTVYKGKNGKREAMRTFLDTLEQAGDSVRAVGYEFSLDHHFSTTRTGSELQKRYQELAQKQIQFNLMLYVNRPAEEIMSMLRYWLPICFESDIGIYYTYANTPPTYDSIHYIQNQLAVLGTGRHTREKDQYTISFTDALTLGEVDSYIQKMLKQFKPLTQYLHTDNIYTDFSEKLVRATPQDESEQYIILDDNTFFTMDAETASFLMLDLHLTPRETSLLADFCRQCPKKTMDLLGNQKASRIAISDSAVRRLARNKTVEIPILSSLLGRPVRVASKYVAKEMLAFMKIAGEYGKTELALMPEDTELFFPSVNIVVKKDNYVYLHPANNPDRRIVLHEFSSVRAFYMRAETFWAHLPYECKNIEQIRRKLEEIVSEK